MIKVKEMKKLIERVEEFPEYSIVFKTYDFIDMDDIINSREEARLELQLDHKNHKLEIWAKP